MAIGETRPDGPRPALREIAGRRAHGLLDRALGARLRLEVAARVEAEVRRRLDELLPALEARAAEVAFQRVRSKTLTEPLVFGPADRVHIAASAVVNDALLNTVSGSITVADDAFFGHGVRILTGTHDVTRRGLDRQHAIPTEGRDVHVDEGAWIGSGAIVLGPCRIGAHSVVCAGSVVTGDVAPETVVAGMPTRVVRTLS